MALSSAQIVRIVTSLKEAAAQLDDARLAARRAADQRTEDSIAVLIRNIVREIAHLEILRQNAP
jgi:hypothetical protein